MDRTIQNAVTKNAGWLINIIAESVERVHNASGDPLDLTNLVWNIPIKMHVLAFFFGYNLVPLTDWKESFIDT